MSIEMSPRKLLTVISESALEDTLIGEIEALGAHGYTVTEARGKGGRGKRDAAWSPQGNIRLEVLCSEATALAISQRLRERYYDNYSMVLYLSDVSVMRPDKF